MEYYFHSSGADGAFCERHWFIFIYDKYNWIEKHLSDISRYKDRPPFQCYVLQLDDVLLFDGPLIFYII